MNNRIKQLRKKLNLTQQEFANRLGLKRNSVANYETGRNTPIDPIITSMCREFNVNEDWLRHGTGGAENMFIPDDMTFLNNIGKLGNEKNEFKKFYLNTMMNLPDEFWDYLYNEFKKFSTEKGE